ncbi:MAG TPA: putative Na+/H+ antiporter, partial [Candidatus Polarisedimenticolia bacterium]|nr:putative Na+/H+ antiporter [Candidatus Polarisedimenticolia bacterium]
IAAQPFNLWATLIFLGAIVHTFLTHRLVHAAHALEKRRPAAARCLHFLGEVEAVFGIWMVPLMLVMIAHFGLPTARAYLDDRVTYTEAVFVVVIMAIAGTRPVLDLAERAMGLLARAGGGSPAAWWAAILTVGPLLGSFITEPGAMTICAALLSRRVYARGPSRRLAYGTLGLLFVAISAGGTLTHFAAPPVLMVAGPWEWNTGFMLTHFGWRAALGIFLSVAAYFVWFRRDLAALATPVYDPAAVAAADAGRARIPIWVTGWHLAFMVLAVACAHSVALLFLVLLFFLAFVEVTEEFQSDFTLRPPILVGFFLAGLVIHGGLQQWWIAPVLGRLGEVPLFLGATVLTAFNDNAAITYLATLVPTLTEGMKYAVVAGAVTGGGLTVIANAPNPAGQSILGRHFEDGIGAAGLLLGAIVPTILVGLAFMLFR